MNTKSIYLLVATLLCVLSCNKHEGNKSIQIVSFNAVQGDDPVSKTVLQSDGAVYWNPGDAIKLFYGSSNSGRLTADNRNPAARTTFTGQLDGLKPNGDDYYWAVYPYSDDTGFNGSAITLSLPGTQTGVAGTFADDLFPSMARSKDKSLTFYNVCGGIKFSVAVEGIKYVTFSGNNSENLAGQVKVGFGADGRPVIREVISGKKVLRLNAPGGSFKVGESYYLVSFPARLKKGYTLSFYSSDGLYNECKGNSEVEIKRSVWGVLAQSPDPQDPEDPEDTEDPEDPQDPVDPDPEDPYEPPLSITVKCPEKLDFGPSYAGMDLKSQISYTVNRSDYQSLRAKLRSSESWIYTSGLEDDLRIQVNGNASVKERTGSVYVDVFYGEYHQTGEIQIQQGGVKDYISSASNFSQFELYEGATPANHTLMFTPYGGTESVTVVGNSDGFLDPMHDGAYPELKTGDSFVQDQDFPSVYSDINEKGDIRTITISYDSNRAVLHRGCRLNYVPLIWVVEDWEDPVNTYLPHYVANLSGGIEHIKIDVLQSPIYVVSEYSDYYAMPVSGPMDTDGKTQFKPNVPIIRPSTASYIMIQSNVAWEECKQLYQEDEFVYSHSYGPSYKEGDGKRLTTTYVNVEVENRLSVFEDEFGYTYSYYRPQKDYGSLQSKYRVWVDLKDGMSPLLLNVADLIHVGMPYTKVDCLDIEDGPRGSYEYNGVTYEYRDVVTCSVKTVCDDVTKAFLTDVNLECSYDNVDGVYPVPIHNGQEDTYKVTFYAHPDDPDDWLLIRRVLVDWSCLMVNGVEVRAEERYDDHWSDWEPRMSPGRFMVKTSIGGKALDRKSSKPSGVQESVFGARNHFEYPSVRMENRIDTSPVTPVESGYTLTRVK